MSDFEKSINASDLIDWIMCAFPDWCVGDVRKIVDHINEMAPAQPEIIRCRDCEHFMKWRSEKSAKKFGQEYECECGRLNCPEPDDFCSKAERR